jgi:hypothetical protein
MSLVSMARPVAQDATAEYRLKAAFLSKFPQFVQWPAGSLKPGAVNVCIVRPSPFGKVLNELLSGETVQGGSVTAREIAVSDALEPCHVLFISRRSSADEQALLARAARLPLLTIGETETFLDHNGIINLRVDDRRVRFEINVAAADRVGLRISSQLLRLAERVRGGVP